MLLKILCISGSSARQSSNSELLVAIGKLFPNHSFTQSIILTDLPLYSVDNEIQPTPSIVNEFKSQIISTEAIIISTPEYLHNIPAVLKNAFEWLKTNGEIQHKRVLAITFTPKKPRGEKAMTSLLYSLQALEATIVGSLALYKNEMTFHESGIHLDDENSEMLTAAIQLLVN